MAVKPIQILTYDPEWSRNFELLRGFFITQLGHMIQEIYHVGSTAVPGLSAKPVIDLDIVLTDLSKLEEAIDKLHQLGYIYRGEMGITGRHVFSADGSTFTFAHHMYICDPHSDAFKNHISLRDFLRSNAAASKQYGELKKQLIQSNAYDMDAYVHGKTAFITGILAAAGFERSSLDLIQKENTFKT